MFNASNSANQYGGINSVRSVTDVLNGEITRLLEHTVSTLSGFYQVLHINT